MKAYSTDLRKQVVRAAEEGRPREEIIHLFGVSRATIKRYVKQQRETGDLTPKPIPGRPASKGDALRSDVWGQLETNREATLPEQCQIWETTHGQQVSPATMSRAISDLGWTRKKRRWWPPNATKRREQPGASRPGKNCMTSGSSLMNARPISL